jgi:NAD(P)-dependent dehydrogenase (short-subunit alcohol dehydrogenase family)
MVQHNKTALVTGASRGIAMNDARSVNARANLWPTFAGRGAGTLLEIDAWIPSEISAISPLVERLMRLIEGSHCVTGEETAVAPGSS